MSISSNINILRPTIIIYTDRPNTVNVRVRSAPSIRNKNLQGTLSPGRGRPSIISELTYLPTIPDFPGLFRKLKLYPGLSDSCSKIPDFNAAYRVKFIIARVHTSKPKHTTGLVSRRRHSRWSTTPTMRVVECAERNWTRMWILYKPN